MEHDEKVTVSVIELLPSADRVIRAFSGMVLLSMFVLAGFMLTSSIDRQPPPVPFPVPAPAKCDGSCRPLTPVKPFDVICPYCKHRIRVNPNPETGSTGAIKTEVR